ncbi:MAG: group III truncated hemoglobin [Bryobacteraceae bacterium]|nr:group III truncated hemoglobin [Bryobacteraceae bacterium]
MSFAASIGQPAIARVVDAFYARITQHPTLAAPFAHITDWPRHRERMTYFWWTALGGERSTGFHFDVARQHLAHGFNRALLTDWLALFALVLRDELPAEQAFEWLALAERMGQGLAIANDHLEKQHASIPLTYSRTRHPALEAHASAGAGARMEDPPRPSR